MWASRFRNRQLCLQVQGSSSGSSGYTGGSLGSVVYELCLASPETLSLSAWHYRDGGNSSDRHTCGLAQVDVVKPT